nr:MAG TPA: hypothetical protein [Caudoviricetes sp.]
MNTFRKSPQDDPLYGWRWMIWNVIGSLCVVGAVLIPK